GGARAQGRSPGHYTHRTGGRRDVATIAGTHVACSRRVMTVNCDDVSPSALASRSGWLGYCQHDAARQIPMYMPDAQANAVRLRLIRAGDPRWRHVSPLYEIPHGWAWTLCNECPAGARADTTGQ